MRKRSREEKVGIVMEGLTTSVGIGEICRKHNISHTQYYAWRDKFLEGGRKALSSGASTEEKALQREVSELKELVGDLTIANNAFKKTLNMRR